VTVDAQPVFAPTPTTLTLLSGFVRISGSSPGRLGGTVAPLFAAVATLMDCDHEIRCEDAEQRLKVDHVTEGETGNEFKIGGVGHSGFGFMPRFIFSVFTAQCTLVHMRGLGIACRLSVCL